MKKLKKGLLIGLAIGLVGAGVVGLTGYLTNGFTNVDKIVDITKHGEVVASFKYQDSAWKTEDGDVLTISGLTNEFGEESSSTARTLTELKTTLRGFGKTNAEIEDIYSKTSSLNDVFYSTKVIDLDLSETSGAGKVGINYFDTFRICYTVPNSKYVGIASVGGTSQAPEYIAWAGDKDVITGVEQVLEIGLIGEEDVLAQEVKLFTAGINGSADTSIEIKSIDFVRKGAMPEDEAKMYLPTSILDLAD